MSLTGLLLISNSELLTLAAFWFTGALLIVSLFFANRARIRHHE